MHNDTMNSGSGEKTVPMKEKLVNITTTDDKIQCEIMK